uniref:Uncharacterized protein n=1 Tax=Triticum urartu TaxID=4572 RepID=A0A8R7TVC1_TRIUA
MALPCYSLRRAPCRLPALPALSASPTTAVRRPSSSAAPPIPGRIPPAGPRVPASDDRRCVTTSAPPAKPDAPRRVSFDLDQMRPRSSPTAPAFPVTSTACRPLLHLAIVLLQESRCRLLQFVSRHRGLNLHGRLPVLRTGGEPLR